MCGLTGMLVSEALTDRDRAEVRALTALVDRRGPDDVGHWDDGAHCALGFRRLAILDPSPAAHQPMTSADGRHVVVFNGEVYGFRRLRDELEAEGARLRSGSDTEVVVEALAHWGDDALVRLDGMFALAWYQPGPRRLVLVRDPVGIKPLHWWHGDGVTVFGSQLDQVVRHRRCRRDQVDHRALELYLRLGSVPAPHGLVPGSGQVPPGHAVEVHPGQPPRIWCYRSWPVAPDPSERLRGGEAVEAVAAAVTAAVGRQLVSDRPVGVFLSGGVDSPLVAATAASLGADVPAFSIGTDDTEMDEADAAVTYARTLGLTHHLRRIGGAEALGLVDEVASAYTEPFGDYSSFPTLLVSALAAEHVTVALSGDGGDELFWGYPRFAKVRHARRWFRLPRAARVAAYGATKPLPNIRRPARGIMFPTLGDWYLDAHAGLRTADLAAIAPSLELDGRVEGFALDHVPDDDGLLQWMRGNELAFHLQTILQKVDRASMHHSLEVRVPLLDLEVLDVAARVDPSAALTPAGGKQVLRRALERHVPPATVPVAKRGFTVPLGRWLRHDLRPLVEELLGEGAYPAGLFDATALRQLYEPHRTGALDRTRGLWNLLALQLWARTHLRPLPTAVRP